MNKLFQKIKQPNIQKYQNYLAEELKLSPATVKRRLSSIRKFCEWANKEGYLEKNPFVVTQGMEKSLQPKTNILSKAYKKYHSISITKYFHWALLIIFCAALGFGVYDQFFKKAPSPFAYPTELTRPNRYLSFQGRLTDSSDNPITSATNISFRLWNVAEGGDEGTCTGQTGEECLWTSGNCTVTPDQDGIFSIILGTTSGEGYTCSSAIEIPSSVFTENQNVYLGVKVASDDEMTPRIQVATVGYALNAETLQGFPPGTGINSIPYINNEGNILIAAASPMIQATSGTFAIEGQTGVTIQAGSGVGGSITLAPKGDSGVVNLTSQATTGNLLNNQSGANFGTTGGKEANNLYYGYAGTDSTNFNLLKLEAGAEPSAKFTVDASGNASAAGILKALTSGSYLTGDITVSGGGITGANGVVLDIGDANSGFIISSAGFAVGGGTTYYINSSGTGNLNALTLAGDFIVDTNDFFIDVSENKVGIGTNTLTERLTIAGNATISGTLALAPNVQVDAGTCNASSAGKMYYDGEANKYYFCNGTEWTEMGAGAASYWALNGNYLYPIDLGYSVGIGNSNPSALLSVGSSSQFQVNSSGAITAATGIVSSGNIDFSSLNAGGLVKAAATTGRLSIATGGVDYEYPLTFSNGLTRSSNTVKLGGTLGESTTITQGNFDMIFNLSGDGDFRIQDNGTDIFFVKDDGNIGIGTTNPQAKLSVAGNAIFGSTYVSGGYTAPSNGVIIEGNVGIGTYNPLAKLHIEGGEIWAFNAGNNPRIIIGDNGDTGQYGYLQWDSTNDYYRIETDGVNGLKINGNYVSIGNIYPSQPLIVGSGSTELFRVDESGNVGIGVTGTPASRLEVVGTAQMTGFKMTTGAQAGYVLTSDENGVGTWTDIASFPTAGPWTLSGNNLYPDSMSYNVGIGTSTPANKLSVLGKADISTSLGIGTTNAGSYTLNVVGNTYLNGTLTTTGAISAPTSVNTINNLIINAGALSGVTSITMNNQLINSYANTAAINLTGNGAGITFGSTGPYQIITGGSSNLAMMPGGNLGIGTTNPQMKLDVAGDATISGTLSLGPQTLTYAGTCDASSAGKMYYDGEANKYYFCNGTEWTEMGAGATSFWALNGNYLYPIDLGYSVGIGNSNPSALFSVGSSSQFQVDNSGNLNTSGTLTAATTNTLNGLSINSGTITAGTWAGNVIGVQYGGTGQNWSSVSQGSLPYFSALGIMGTLSIGNSGYVLTSNGTTPTWADISSTAGPWTLSGNNLYPDSTSYNVALGAENAGSAKLYVQGNVGIGTTNPLSALSVGSSSQFQVNSSGAITAATGIVSSGNIDFSSLNAGGLVKAAATTGRLSIATGGVDYEYPLTFSNGLTRSSNTVKLGGTLSEATTINQGNFDMIFNLSGTGNFRIQDNGTDVFFVKDDGNIGIGTTDPASYKLNVAGNVAFNSGNIYSDSNNYFYGARFVDTANTDYYIDPANTGNSAILYGNVGIGTTSPSARLHNVGTTILGTSLTGSEDALLVNVGAAFTGNLLKLSVNSTQKFAIDYTGKLITASGNFLSTVPDGTSAIAFNFDTLIAYTAPGAKLLSIKNAGEEKMSLDKDGVLALYNSESKIFNSAGDITIDAASGNVSFATNNLINIDDITMGGTASISGTPNLTLIPTTNLAKIYLLNGGDLGFYTSVGGDTGATERIRITNEGHLVPATDDTYNLGSDSLRWGNLFLAGETLHLGSAIGDEAIFSYNTSSNNLSINSTGNVILQSTSGNVGIGTTNPTEKLTISGSATISGTLALAPNVQADAGTCNVSNRGKFYYDGVTDLFYYCNGSQWTEMGSGETPNQIAAFAGSCPDGWTEYTAARGRVIVGVPSSGTVEGTVGTALTNLEDRTHTHQYTDYILASPGAGTSYIGFPQGNASGPARVQGVAAVNGSGGTNLYGQTLTTQSASHTMPYIQLRWCKKSTGGGSGIASLWYDEGTYIYPANSREIHVSRLVDTANSDYFIDPAATGQSAILYGSVGIGTTNPSYRFDVQDNQSSSYVARIYNTNTATTADGLLISLGVANGSRTTGNYFVGFSDGAGTVAGKIQGGASAVAYTTTGADLAEYFPIANFELKPEPGDLVTLDLQKTKSVRKTEKIIDSPIGVVSTNPGFVGNGPICHVDDQNCEENFEKSNVAVSLIGQVPLKVTTENGPIKIGDPISSSNLSGFGMKAKQAGIVVGRALESFDPEEGKGEEIACPLNENSQIDITEIKCGLIKVFIEKSLYDPDVYLTSVGELNITENPQLSEDYQLKDNQNRLIEKIDAFAQIAVAKIKAGLIKTQELIAEKKIVSPLAEIEEIKTERLSLAEISPSTESGDIVINLENKENDENEESKFGRLIIKGEGGQEVASIDAQGNASFSGQITSEALKVINDTTISGTLYADKIESQEINTLKSSFGELLAKVDSLFASNKNNNTKGDSQQSQQDIEEQQTVPVTGVHNFSLRTSNILSNQNTNDIANPNSTTNNNSLSSPEMSGGTTAEANDTWPMSANMSASLANWELDSLINSYSSTSSVGLSNEEINKLIDEILASAPEFTAQANLEENIPLNSQYTINNTQYANNNSLTIGNTLMIADNSLNTLTGPLYLQNLGLGGIDILAGKIVIDEKGNATFEENVTVKGTLAANVISPLPEQDLVISLDPESEQTLDPGSSGESKFGKLLIKGVNNEVVASIDASGSAKFNSLSIEADYSATQSGVIIAAYQNWLENGEYSPALQTNATAGVGVLPAYEQEIMIYNSKITDQSLIYITPITNTTNKVIYVKAKKAQKPALLDENGYYQPEQKGWFKVAIDTPINKEIKFNWWVVN